jgi:hypothetical protein
MLNTLGQFLGNEQYPFKGFKPLKGCIPQKTDRLPFLEKKA